MRLSPLSLRLAAATALGKVGLGIGERFGASTCTYCKAEDEGRAKDTCKAAAALRPRLSARTARVCGDLRKQALGGRSSRWGPASKAGRSRRRAGQAGWGICLASRRTCGGRRFLPLPGGPKWVRSVAQPARGWAGRSKRRRPLFRRAAQRPARTHDTPSAPSAFELAGACRRGL